MTDVQNFSKSTRSLCCRPHGHRFTLSLHSPILRACTSVLALPLAPRSTRPPAPAPPPACSAHSLPCVLARSFAHHDPTHMHARLPSLTHSPILCRHATLPFARVPHFNRCVVPPTSLVPHAPLRPHNSATRTDRLSPRCHRQRQHPSRLRTIGGLHSRAGVRTRVPEIMAPNQYRINDLFTHFSHPASMHRACLQTATHTAYWYMLFTC